VEQYVDPHVSRRKFEREVAEYRLHEREYRRRGWLLLRAEFPEVMVVFVAANLKPPAIVTGALLDYTNYDAAPPSFLLVDPLTEEPYKASDLPTWLKRQVAGPAFPIEGLALPPGAAIPRIVSEQPLMQWHDPDDVPFLCLAGVREYHEHPAHSGDHWEQHRRAGAGRIARLLEIVDTYGLRPITDYNMQLKIDVIGFAQGQTPE
jgi:hypothetical protein